MSDEATQRTTYQRLAEQFPTSSHKKVKKGGGEQTYIPWTDSVERMNEVLGSDWSFTIIREGMTNTEAWALGEIRATIDGVVTRRQQYGCEPITMGVRETPTGDLFKKAATDALRKTATLLGIGLYLSIQDERLEIEAAMRAEIQAAAKAEADKRAAATKAAKDAATTPKAPAPTPTATSAPTPIGDKAKTAAVLTGANPTPPQPAGYFCVECHGLVKTDSRITIPKKKGGPNVTVSVADFAPVCEERLGGFHCPGCYETKWFGAA